MSEVITILTRAVMLTAYLINTHLVILPIFSLRHEIDDNFELLVYPSIFIILSIILFMRGLELPIGFQTKIFYLLSVTAFIGLIRNVYGVIFGLSFVFFISEFWEIPVYLYRLIMTGEFTQYDNVSQLFTFVGILSKLLTIIYVLILMRMMGMQITRFLKLLMVFTVIYVPLALFVFSNLRLFPFDGHQFAWVCRILCMGLVYGYMLKYYQPE